MCDLDKTDLELLLQAWEKQKLDSQVQGVFEYLLIKLQLLIEERS